MFPSLPAAILGAGNAKADDGWYTDAQVDKGHQLFNNCCTQCHRPDLSDAAGPALVGDQFLAKWGNQPLGNLFAFEHEKMPAVNPGSMKDEQPWPITAYILKKNGFKAGAVRLSDDTGTDRILKAD